MRVRSILPTHPLSKLMLAEYANFWTSLWQCSDYEPEKREYRKGNIFLKRYSPATYDFDPEDKDPLERMYEEDIGILIRDEQWIEQDPMAQVSSTIYPTPIDDLHSWYESCPFYRNFPLTTATLE